MKSLDRLDVNLERPTINLEINRVGIINIHIPIFSMRIGDYSALAIARVSAFINLPPDIKGIHASRNYESIMDVFLSHIGREMRIEEFCCHIAKDLLRRHDYASSSEVKMKCLIIFPQETPRTGRVSYEKSYLLGRAIAVKEDNHNAFIIRKGVGVEVVGITACPSAQRTLLAEVMRMSKDDNIRRILTNDKIPKATHIQRTYARVFLEFKNDYKLNALSLIKIARGSMSSQTYELLKREDEAQVILNALNNPMFTEDVVRKIAKRLIEEFPNLPNDTIIKIFVRSLESIHQHDLVAKLYITAKRLKDYL